jgi:hypothetical protein
VRRIGDRVVVLGAATKRVRDVVVEGGGQTRRPRIAPKGGAFVAVFDRRRVSSDEVKVTVVPLTGRPAIYVGQRNVNVSTLRTNWWQGLPPRGALAGTVQVIPPVGGPATPIDVWFRPTVALDSPLDRYVLGVRGPGGTECTQEMNWRIGGFSWSPQYNKRNMRQGFSLRLLPHRTPYGIGGNPPRETWCAGTFRGRVLLLDAQPHGHRAHKRSLQRFKFSVGGDAMRFRYHGRLIAPNSAARHHLKCIQDFAICDDSNAKVLRDALRLGLPVGGGTVTTRG